jgi:hypothetical protein
MQPLQVTEADVVSGNHNDVKFVPQCNGRMCPLSLKLNIICNDWSLTHVLGSVAGAVPSGYEVCSASRVIRTIFTQFTRQRGISL